MILLSGCKLPGSAFVGKWKGCSSGCQIEISRTGLYTFDVVSSVAPPYTARSEDAFATCGDALCIVNAPPIFTSYRQLKFPEKGNLDLLLYDDGGPGSWGKVTYKRVQ